jgi:Xaa-Pro aminopeptidase
MSRFEARRDRLRKAISRLPVDGFLVTSFTNVTYLTGFTGDSSYLWLTPDNAVVISDGRYTQQLQEECPGLDVEIRRVGVDIAEFTSGIISASRVRRLAIEGDAMSVAFCGELTQRLPQVELLQTSNLVERLREIKDREEIGAIRGAIEIAERAFAVIRAGLRPELTEKQIAYDLEHQIRMFGGSGCSFTPIVGVGPRGALPHATLSDCCIGESPFVLIDWGARARLYMSDLTRVLVTGRIPPKLQGVYEVVLKAQRAAIDAIRPGAVMKDIDAAARGVIEEAGYGKRFNHGLGHGIGLEIHESPRLASNQDRQLRAGMVITVEPGIYLPNWGGVRIEDDILVTRSGHEVLSSVSKEFGDCVLS